MKRAITILLALFLMIGMSACADPPDVNDVVPTDLVEEPEEEEAAPTEAEAEEEAEEPAEEDEEEMADPGAGDVSTADVVVPFLEEWQASAHNDASDAAFTHWDEDDPAEIPANCAKCHSTPGFLDFAGVDGTEAGVVDNAAPLGTTVTCEVCHNEVSSPQTSVVFPSGVEVTGDPAATCMECHQGRSSRDTVNAAIEEAGLVDSPDTIGEDLGFINIHFYAAAATMYGSEVHGGYEYAGEDYQPKFEHVAGFDTCIACHAPHTLEVDPNVCADCHEGVETEEDLRAIRMQGSLVDYDGDGSIDEPLDGEITGLQEMLYTAIQRYAEEVVGTPIIYADSYPYFFVDTNGDGEVQEDEAAFPNAYSEFTPRLLQATYNFQVSQKDPGAFAHNAKYLIQLLYDSTASLNEVISEPVDLSNADRASSGHFAATHDSFRHWDEDGVVPGRCSKCHTAEGIPTFLENGVNINEEPSNSLACVTCHDSLQEFTIYQVDEVTFPSGNTLSFGEGDGNNICLLCHQGREATATVNAFIERAGVGDDEVSEALRFRNPHYFASGATLFGSEAAGAYQFEGEEYLGRFEHVESFDTCSECHDVHALTLEVAACEGCHGEGPLTDIRTPPDSGAIDFDGDGDVEEGIAGEIATMDELLFAAIQDYAANTIGTPIVYDSSSYPYWFNDLNENGVADPDEANYGNQYASWTPTLLRSIYNYIWVNTDPGGYAHNPRYLIQVLYDTLEVIGADTSGLTRPVTPPPSE